MIKIKRNSLKTKIFFKGIIDTMIPASNDKLMPKASDAINMNEFLLNILRDKYLIIKLNKFFFYESKNKKTNFLELGKVFAKSKDIENIIDKDLLEAYFSSNLVKKQLNKKAGKNLSKKKTKNKDNTLLLKLVKNSSLRYKHM